MSQTFHEMLDRFQEMYTVFQSFSEITTEVLEYMIAKQSENPNYTFNDYFNEISFENNINIVKGLLNEMIKLTKVIN